MNVIARPKEGADFYERLADHAGMAYVTLDPHDDFDPIDPDVAELVPEDLCRRFEMIPIAVDERTITIATAHPFDETGPNTVTSMLGRQVVSVVAAPAEIERALDRVYAGRTEAATPDGVAAPPTTEEAIERELDRPDLKVVRRAEQQMLGALLLDRGMITEEQLSWALAEHERTGSPLGEIVHHAGLVDAYDVAAILAEQGRALLVDVASVQPDPRALAAIPEALSRSLRAVPVAIDDEYIDIVFAEPPSAEAIELIREHTPLQIRTCLAPATEIDQLLQRLHAAEYVRVARTDLLNRFPEDCANRVLSGPQKVFLIGLAIATAIGFVLAPLLTAVILTSSITFFYLVVSIYKFRLVYNSLDRRNEIQVTAEEIAALDERELPIYTILVPLYREAEVLPRLTEQLSALDYPKTKLDIRLLVEEDDEETIAMIESLDLFPHFRMVIVPDSQPKTKPKACNYGMLQAEGRYVVIYDAEDRPDPDQLKKAVIAFRRSPSNVVCIQAALNYFNQEQNLLTRWFSTEYAMWFDLLLPGLSGSHTPIPLGGTSNHFVRDVLTELGGWDPFNVTEDADLGIRLHKAGYACAVLESTTLEEANSDLGNWVRQRSRWIKGYIQTYLVHMRHPFRLMRQIGLRSWLSFQFIVGGTVIFLLNPIMWALTTLWLFTEAGFIEAIFPGFLYYAAAALLFVGNFTFAYLNVAGSLHRGYFSLAKYALASPIYWGLMSIGAWKGFIQLITKPFYWEKTVHGLDVAGGAAPRLAARPASTESE